MAITFGEARKILSQYAGIGGKCAESPEVYRFVIKVLQFMLHKGEHGNERRYSFNALNGCITIPPELEVPLKVKIDGEVGTVWDRWFEFKEYGELNKCLEADNCLTEDPNSYPIVYDHTVGWRVGVVGHCNEAEDAYVLVQGTDPTGREIFTVHKGEQVAGEYLRVVKGQLRYTQVAFGKITGITKSKTEGYVSLYSYSCELSKKKFLADYSPLDELPAYRRFKLSPQYCTPCSKVTILGRIKLKENYADTDRIPFDNYLALELAAQAVNSQFNDNVQIAKAKVDALNTVISEENAYKKPNNGQIIEVAHITSGGAIRNIIY